ncbi:MAG: dipicolinate synthase subunit DpsA [Oscillospiraceae bacterium]|jgi:dipicolinate synthase subunit A|nr:dipicolinate synthase subunit DpsA [Oscillospiraceae bacterium]
MFLVVGGDLRQIYTAKKLAENDRVEILGFNNNITIPDTVKKHSTKKADILILPLPVSIDNTEVNAKFSNESIPLSSLPSMLKEGGVVFGGKTAGLENIFPNTRIIDYFKREELSVFNAVPTVEGAIQIAMENTAETLFGQKVLVTGWGRISKVLCKVLVAMGAKTDVYARKCSDLAWAQINGCKAVKNLEYLEEYNLIFNTVPACIFTENVLRRTNRNALVIDLASNPGGVEFNTAQELGIKVIWALSLPGKVAPITAGEIIATAILNSLEEMN